MREISKKWDDRAVWVEERLVCHCLHCNHVWTPRNNQLPKKCPHCGSPNWMKPPKWRWDQRKKERQRALRKHDLRFLTPLELEGWGEQD